MTNTKLNFDASRYCRHNALREAVAWERKAACAYNAACASDGYGQMVWATENLRRARAEVDRLIANESAADCKGEG